MLKKKWGNIPLIVSGIGEGGVIAANTAFGLKIDSNAQHKIEKIVTVNSDFSQITSMRGKSELPLDFILGSDYISRYHKVTAPHTKVIELENAPGFTLGKEWYNVLDKYLGLK